MQGRTNPENQYDATRPPFQNWLGPSALRPEVSFRLPLNHIICVLKPSKLMKACFVVVGYILEKFRKLFYPFIFNVLHSKTNRSK